MATDVSSVTKHFPSAEDGFTTTLASTISSGAATVPLNSVSGYANGEVVVFYVDPDNATKKQSFTGTVDTAGVQLTGVVWLSGTNQSHTAGSTVVDYESAGQWSMMAKGLLRDHNQSGYHKTLNDDNGNEWIKQTSLASAVNEITVANAATGNNPVISATGGDTNVGLTLTPKGTGSIQLTSRADGWVTGLTAPTTVTALGNRSYSLVINSIDYTDRLSAGMRIRTTRTVAAPTQCTDLENGSSQYYSKTSPNKLTFTDDYTMGAWVKLESFAAGGIIARRNADVEGFSLSLNATGQILAGAYRIAANNSVTTSTQSVPLNRWVHIAASTDLSGTSVLIYMDGVLVPSATVITGTITAIVQGTTALVVGAEKSAGTNPFDGKIAQAFVATGVISAANLNTLKDQGLTAALISSFNIQSAYSFDNSIADLNTTTPNDLTAQGSALATNADSPFGGQADGTISSTIDYGIITKTAFSTNTTLTVQVPEGCTIPTSGGITALAYSTQKTPYGFLASKGRWRLENFSLDVSSLTTGSRIPGLDMLIPIGSWIVWARASGQATRTAATATNIGMGISTSTTTITVLESKSFDYGAASAQPIGCSLAPTVPYGLDLTVATTYYATQEGTYTTLALNSGSAAAGHVFVAEFAYL